MGGLRRRTWARAGGRRSQPSRADPGIPKHLHDVLLGSIQDVQSAIIANDTKASAALIVHGLLFTGLITLLVDLGGVYQSASEAQQISGLGFLFASLVAFVISIYFILGALLPYHPDELERQLRSKYPDKYKEVFFPVALLDTEDPYGALLMRLDGLDDDAAITYELAAERIKLADILRHESTQTRWGYLSLRAEIAFASAFLIVVATAVL
jgi:hypothetical protein